MKFVEALGLTNKLVFDPELGVPPFSAVGDEMRGPRGLRYQTRSKVSRTTKGKSRTKKDSEVTQDGTLNSVALASESNGFSCFDELSRLSTLLKPMTITPHFVCPQPLDGARTHQNPLRMVPCLACPLRFDSHSAPKGVNRRSQSSRLLSG